MEVTKINPSSNINTYNQITNEGIFFKYPQWDKDISISNLIPIKIGGHQLTIGKGTFSEVYLSKHNDTEKIYAVKHMQKQLILKTMHTLQIIEKEIEIHSKLFHRNIARLYNKYENKTDIYLILEHADKGSLFSIMKQNGPFNESDARKYFIQVVSAVHFLHRNNVIHRDIKPENILLNNEDEIKLCDFGWANYVESDITRNTFCGTLEYMSPEILGKEEYTKEIDIWALGVLLYELVHGYSPFIIKDNDTCGVIIDYKDILENIQDKGIKFEVNISEVCKDLIRKMLEVDGKKRINIDDIVKHPFIIGNVNKQQMNLKEISIEFDRISNENEEEKQIPITKNIRASSLKNVINKYELPIKKEQVIGKVCTIDNKKISSLLFGDDIDVLEEELNGIGINKGKNISKGMKTPSGKNKITLKFNMVNTECRKHISAASLPTMSQAAKFHIHKKGEEEEQRSTEGSSKNSQCNKDEMNYK